MYGMVNQGIKDYVTDNLGEPTWRKILEKSGLDSDQFETMLAYDDDLTYKLVFAASDVLGLRASVRIARGAYKDALTDLNEAIARNGPLPRLLLLRASAHRQSGALIEARDDATYATELEPRMAAAWLERGRIEARIKDRDSARDSLLEAIDLDRDGEIGKTAQNVLQRMEAGLD